MPVIHNQQITIMKKYMTFTFMLLFILAGMVACEDKEPQYEIYENHEISACGEEDPLKNMEWLEEDIKKYPAARSIEIFVYANNITEEELIVEVIFSKYQWHIISFCNGENVFSGEYDANSNITSSSVQYSDSPRPCYECEEFYETHHKVGLIYSKKKI